VAAAVVALAAAGLVAAVAYRHRDALPFEPGLLLAFDATRVPKVLRALGLLAAFNLAAWAAGGAVARLLRASGAAWPLLNAVQRLGLGLVALSYAVLGMAALHALYRPLLAGMLGVLALAGAAQIARLALRRTWPRPRMPRPAAKVAAGAGAVVLAVAALSAFMPDYGWDAFTYHLALPERYLFTNGIVVSPYFAHSAFPLTVQMVYALALAVDPGPLAKLLHAEMGLLTVLVVAALAGRHTPRAGALAALALLADPLFNWELGVAYTDLGAALFAVLALAALEERLAGGGAPALRRCGVFAGACAATRYTAATVPVALLAVLALAPLPRARKLRDGAAIAALCLLMMAPWLARNLAFTGNPLAPALQGLFHQPGQEFFNPVAIAQQVMLTRRIGFGYGLDDLVALPVNLTVRAGGDYSTFGFRVGPFCVAGLAAALALSRARRAPAGRGALLAAGVLLLAWFFTSQEPRYLLPALALGAVAAGVGWDEVLRALARIRPGLSALGWAVPVAAAAHGLWAPLARLPYVWGYALGGLSVEGFESQEPALMAARRLRGLLGPRDRLLLVYEPRGFFFQGLDYVYAHYFDVMQQIHQAGDAEGVAILLRELGVTHVLVNANNVSRYGTVAVPGYGEEDLMRDLNALQRALERHSTPLLDERGVFVHRMRWAPDGPRDPE
jgi:hypothetical protein